MSERDRSGHRRPGQTWGSVPCTLAAMAALISVVVDAADWPRFQAGTGTSANIPIEWSPTANQLWSASITGYGQSSPVTWDDRTYVASISGPNKEQAHLAAFDLGSGKKLWQHDVKSAAPAENNVYVSRAAPTPCVDAEGVYWFVETGNLQALSHAGEVRWERNLVESFGPVTARHGLAASLEQTGSRLFVWVERQAEPYLMAVDKQTGRELWNVPGLKATSWASPRLVPVGEGFHLVLSGSGRIAGYDPETGARLWLLEGLSGNTSATPVPAGDGAFVIGASSGRGEPEGTGKASDSTGLVAIRTQENGAFTAEFVWRAKRATASFSSPLVHGNEVYLVNTAGVLFCLDRTTGKEHYAERLPETVWATPLAASDRIYIPGKGGTVAVIAAGPEFKRLAENRTWESEAKSPAPPETGRRGMGGPTLYAAAVAGDRLLLRRGDTLFCIGASAAK